MAAKKSGKRKPALGSGKRFAALKAKIEHLDAQIMYARRANKRGDARHPPRVRRDA